MQRPQSQRTSRNVTFFDKTTSESNLHENAPTKLNLINRPRSLTKNKCKNEISPLICLIPTKIDFNYNIKKESRKYRKLQKMKVDAFKMFKTKSRILNKI